MKNKPIAPASKLNQYSTLLIILIPFILYISALQLGFVYFDDDILILDNYDKISHLTNIGLAFRTDAFLSNLSPYYRPLMNVSFMVDAAIGGKSPMIYHLGNLIYHMLTCLSLMWLLSLMGLSKNKAFIGTLIFAVHPMMGHAVLWIPARGDLLVTLFGLLSFSLFIRYLNEKKIIFLLLHIVCLTGAIFSKESAVLLPVLFGLWLVVRKEKLFEIKALVLYGSWILIFATWYWLRLKFIDQRSDDQRGIEALIQNIQFLPEAVTRFFFPFMLPVTPVFSATITLAGVVLIIGIVVFIFRQGTRIKLPLIIFGAAWFLGFCMPNMFVRLTSANDSFEYLLHRTYLPYVGFLIMLLGACPEKWFEFEKRPYSMIIGSLLVLLSLASLFQQKKYKDAMSYWGSSIQYAPDKAWFHYFMGRYYFKQKDYTQFNKYLLKAVSLKSYPEFKYHLGMVAFMDKKDYEAAYLYFSEAFKEGFGDAEAHTNFIGLCLESSSDLFQKGSYAKAVVRCEEALANDPENGVVAYNLGIYLVNVGEKQRAAAMWKRAIHLKPDLSEAYRSLFLYYKLDVKKADSAAWYAREFNKHGGTGNLNSPQ
ncbi:MAG: tetratricopeptide repeat protein [Bacteroidetes bacterium]|nr:tetratricopeptide repeat protein [Bacteroidota bacterium]